MRWMIYLLVSCFMVQNFWAQDYMSQRKKMVREQLERRGITDKATLKAMQDVPRHLFVPNKQQSKAYWDGPLAIGHAQTISQPYIVAYMTEALQLKPTDQVLEIGTGSGYQAAVLAEIVDAVYTIEIVEPLGIQAKQRLKDLRYNNVIVRIGDGYHGWKEHAPFDAIIVTAAVEEIPKPLLDQLAENGRLIIPAGPKYGKVLKLVTKKNGELSYENKLPVAFVPFTRDKGN